MNIFLGLPVGAVLSIILMAVFLGGFETALNIILLSIICTAGIGLVIWIPIWWVIGWVVLTIVNRARGKKPPPLPKESPQIQAVRNFILSAQGAGDTEAQIDQKLLAAGWPQAVIDDARSKLS